MQSSCSKVAGWLAGWLGGFPGDVDTGLDGTKTDATMHARGACNIITDRHVFSRRFSFDFRLRCEFLTRLFWASQDGKTGTLRLLLA
jgi:hypothetical protein